MVRWSDAPHNLIPLIWRRVQMCRDNTLVDLYYVIQIAMSWSNYYLHWFTIYGKHFTITWHDNGKAHAVEAIRLSKLDFTHLNSCALSLR